MEIDDAIARLGEKLDSWIDSMFGLLESNDEASQRSALSSGYAIATELEVLKREGIKSIKALLKRQANLPTEQRIAALIQGFEFSTKLSAALYDVLLDVKSETKILKISRPIYDTLDMIDPDKTAITALLDHKNDDIRVAAASHLINQMPDRVLPIFCEIRKKGGFCNAAARSRFMLMWWEHEGKRKFASNRPVSI